MHVSFQELTTNLTTNPSHLLLVHHFVHHMSMSVHACVKDLKGGWVGGGGTVGAFKGPKI